MSKLSQLYKNYKDGIIFTLIFHILIFIALNISQFSIKREFKEAEILINFPEEILKQPEYQQNETKNINNLNTELSTNIASNKSISQLNKDFDEEYQKELEEAQNLVKDVSQQLSKEIPTIDDLQIPEEVTEGMDQDSILNKLYNGNSNVEYFLENRFHVRLPIPVYLSQYGGIVTVKIIVDQSGKVVKAEPVIEKNLNNQILSYAKTAAIRTKFNPILSGDSKQSGYIKYIFIAQ